MRELPASLTNHRVSVASVEAVSAGAVRFAPVKALWFSTMLGTWLGAGLYTVSFSAVALFLVTTGLVLLLGHSLGSHRRLIHGSYECPRWLEYLFVYFGVLVGLDGPIGLLRQHELRDYAQRLPTCHDYLRHGRSFWQDGWWQLFCKLHLRNPPRIRIEPRIAGDRFYVFLQRTWMAQQIPWALLFYAWGGWSFVVWGVCARVTAGVGGHWLIGYFAHNRGGMHFAVRDAAVQGHNVRFTSLLTMGECWHNNHHAFPGSAKLGLHPGEWDPGWWTLVALRRCGLVWNIRLPSDLPARPELEQLRASNGATLDAGATVAEIVRLARQPGAGRPALIWPAKRLSPAAMSCVLGDTCEVTIDKSAARLTILTAQRRVAGLPALCIALACRYGAIRRLAWLLLPPAVALERLRVSLGARA
jgi:stearoyl-CoA desaturase (delta-9 desaturase)